MKFLLTYFRNLFTKEFESEFEPSEEDLLAIENIKLHKDMFSFEEESTSDRQEEKDYQEKINLNLLLEIYDEAKLKTDITSFNSTVINFKELDEYNSFLKEDSETKVQFLYFLIKMIKTPLLETSNIDERFKAKLFGSILETKLIITNKNMIDFFLFWNKQEFFCLWVPERIIIQKVKQLAKDKRINNELIKILERYVFRYSRLSSYENEVYLRVITDYKYRKETIPFFLIPDNFGKNTNKVLLNSEEEQAILLSNILELLSLKKKTKSQEEKLEQALKEIDGDFFLHTCINLLEFSANFKPKMVMIFFWQSWKKKKILLKEYLGMCNENLTIVFELVKILQQKELINKIPIEIITTIAKRSYTVKQEFRLSSGATKLGDLSIEILVSNFESKGKLKLKEIYNEVPYKKVKKKIDEIL